MKSNKPLFGSTQGFWRFLQETTMTTITLTEKPTMVFDSENETSLGTLPDHLQTLWVLRENLKVQLASNLGRIEDLISCYETDARTKKPTEATRSTFMTTLAGYVEESKNLLLPFHVASKLLESGLQLDYLALCPKERSTVCVRKDFMVIARANDLREDWKCPCHALVEAISGYTEKTSQEIPGSFTFEVMFVPLYPLEAPKEDAAEPAPQAEAQVTPQG